MTTFIALYRGETVATAKIIVVTSEPALVREMAERLLATASFAQNDHILREIEQGRRRALRLIHEDGK
jgi:hypothetical protein